MEELERAFKETAKLILGEALTGIDDYGKWLGGRVPLPRKAMSALSGREVWLPPPLDYTGKEFDKKRVVDLEERESVNKSPFKPSDLEGAGLDKVLSEIVKPVAYNCGNFRYKSFRNVEKSSGAGDGANIYRSEDVYFDVKNIAYGNFVLYSENMFGCYLASYSKFCIHTYNSVNVMRGFEVDGCSNSSDVYFCHNSENLENCILCFNAKGLRHAVGNTEVGREEFLRVKEMLLGYVVKELRKTKELAIDIFNIGCRH